jgi:hypothetical protein
MRGMVQFSLKRIFISVTLIAVGVASLTSPIGRFYFTHPSLAALDLDHVDFWLFAWLSAALWIGAGLGLSWRHPIRGACIGALLQFIVWGSLSHFS